MALIKDVEGEFRDVPTMEDLRVAAEKVDAGRKFWIKTFGMAMVLGAIWTVGWGIKTDRRIDGVQQQRGVDSTYLGGFKNVRDRLTNDSIRLSAIEAGMADLKDARQLLQGICNSLRGCVRAAR
jgi:hypothetical protein